MAVTVTDDVTTFDAADATIGNWSVNGFAQPAFDPDAAVQGTNCVEARGISNGGVGTIVSNAGNTSFYNGSVTKHLYAWARQSWIWATVGAATPGVQLRISTSANGSTNFSDFAAAGQDRGVTSFKGWVNVCHDVKQIPHSANGTQPERANSGNGLTQVPTMGLEINFLTGNNKTAALIDEIKLASRLIIGGGTTADPGKFQEISTNDETNGDGFFKNVGGVFFTNISIRFGNLGSASSEFSDIVSTIVFEDWDVAGNFYSLMHLGNATGTNNFQLGEVAGTGVDEVGSNGCVIQSAGAAPWHIHCDNANTDKVAYYGCTFIGPPTFSLYEDTHRDVFVEDNSASSFTYERWDATEAGTTGTIPVFTTAPAINDACYFGNDMPWDVLQLNVQTAKNGTYTIVWEYWNGSAWASLPNLKEGTNNFAITGTNFVVWDTPDDWALNTVNSREHYWVRARISAFTSSTVAPVVQSAYPYVMPQMKFETASFEMITGTMIGMGSVKVRNGANLKKVSINGSVHTGTRGAVDVGSADPSANTVRDLTISNCGRGMLFRGTSTGTTTYNLRNVVFDNNGNGLSTIVEDNSLSSFAIQSDEPNNDTANDTNVFPATAALNDAFYVVLNGDHDTININVGTAGVGTYSVTWEYWNGAAWTALSGVTDGTNAFKNTGAQTVSFTRPTDWTWTDINAAGFYGLAVRARISSFTSMTTNPLVTRVQLDGDIRVDFPGAATVEINILEGGTTPTIDNVNGSTININNTVNIDVGGVTEGTSVKVVADETVGTITAGDVIGEGFADSNGEFATSINYEAAFGAGLSARVRARNQGIAVKCWQEDNSGASFVDETADASSNTTADVNLFPASAAINDAFYIGHTEQFDAIRVDLSTAAAGTHTILWEYWNGSAWASLTVTRDDTTNLTTTGTDHIIQWTIPGNWATTTVNSSSSQFYVRARLSAFTSMTTNPLASKLTVNATRYLPYDATRTITSAGLADIATWTEDTISSFFID